MFREDKTKAQQRRIERLVQHKNKDNWKGNVDERKREIQRIREENGETGTMTTMAS